MIFQVAIDEVIANRLLLKEVIYANICESSLSISLKRPKYSM